MRTLVIGKGGREHAIVKGLGLSLSTTEVHAIPGSHGMSSEALCHNIDMRDHEKVVSFCKKTGIGLVVVGPEDPLTQGLADSLRAQDILVFGPGAEGARLEGSKIFSKEFMTRANVPTASYQTVDSVESCMAAVSKFDPPYVLKADGLAAGKGVFICESESELKSAADDLFVKKTLGAAGERAIIEAFQPGKEISVFILTNGEEYSLLPFAQDHKRLLDGNRGPNTGGMGAFAPMDIPDDLTTKIIAEVVEPTVAGFRDQGIDYRGLLYIGVMVTDEGPRVLEYNVRFGDPEAQVLIPMLEGDWAQIFKAIAEGRMPETRFKKVAVSCVVLASPGYPESSKSVTIRGDLASSTPVSYFIHAGTSRREDHQWITSGGRVLGAIGIGEDVDGAIEKAYKQAAFAEWDGQLIRKDIGKFRIEL